MFDLKWLKKRFRDRAEAEAAEEAAPDIQGYDLEKEVADAFRGCGDFAGRTIWIGGQGELKARVCWLDGLVSGEAVSQLVLRPLAESPALRRADSAAQAARLISGGAVYSYSVTVRRRADEVAGDITQGCCAVFLAGRALTFDVRSKEHRNISAPTLERSALGARDSFTEVFRVNTALVRSRVRTSELKLREFTLGRRSHTKVALLYLEGAARPELIDALGEKLSAIDIDGVTGLGDLEEYLATPPGSLFPRLLYTERPDRFARALLEGRAGILADGIPLGLLLPGTLPEMLRVAEDRSAHAAVASTLLVLRWAALLLSLLLPALYVAVTMYHPEMIPFRLLQSIIESKQRVPFDTASEILGMLVTFGLLQEAGLRLPDAAGTTVSIIGTLVVGQSAVEARVVSPIAVIVVALAGIAGYTQPNQELGAALRLWRFFLVLFALALGLYGLMLGSMVLLWRLCALESGGVCYLYPLADGTRGRLHRTFLRLPLRTDKERDGFLSGGNRRRQK